MMSRLWRTMVTIAVVDYVYNGKYVVSGVLNQSCVTFDDSCSVCCAGQECYEGFFPNSCTNGCIDGHRGYRCYELCTFNCKKCDIDVDICTSCIYGFYLGDNSDCKSKCLSTCKNCSSGTSCISCKEGFYNKDGSSDCRYHACPTNCVCSNGGCVACISGFFDISKLCSSRCPINCLECSSNLQCSSCKDGFFNDNGLTKTCSRSCRNNCTICSSYNECLQCQPGMFGKQCHEQCSVGCKNNVCEIETGKCNCKNTFSGENCTDCISERFGVSCERICPYNCNNAICGKTHGECTKGCKLDTMTGTYCENCVFGKYGISCDDICPEKCSNGACDKENGTCTQGCEEGFKGLFCFGCVLGKYGDECNYDCPDRCKDNECKKESGHCFNCTGNFDGSMCDVCRPGVFGFGCDRICSSKCFNDSCDKDSGKCINGCQDNYSGDKCCVSSGKCSLCKNEDTCRECASGYFGQTCSQACSDLCINFVCEMNTGICTQGCTSTSNDSICLRSHIITQDSGIKYDPKDTTIAVLATLFALSTFALCVLISVLMIKNFLSSKRRHKETMVLDGLERSTTDMQHRSNRGENGEEGNVTYETLDGTQQSIDYHMYESANVCEKEDEKYSDTSVKYVNV